MNVETGEIKEFPAGEEPKGPWVKIANRPDPTCKKCLGTGSTRRLVKQSGRRGAIGYKQVPCACVNPFTADKL